MDKIIAISSDGTPLSRRDSRNQSKSKKSYSRKEKGSAGDIGIELEVRMIDENDILLVSEEEPDFNRHKAGYVNMGGAQQMTKLPGND